jgi:glyoxylase-like metal-dependent hydrolase (beta-lactamase superfamily II)
MTHLPYTDLPDRISCIDTLYQRPGLAACYLIESAGEAALIDTGTAPMAPRLLALLTHKGIRPEQVKYVIPTHVHLDHAGASGQLMQQLPRARLVVHPRGARHLIDPTKLIAGATAVYGEAKFKALYGELLPVPAQRVLEAVDGLILELGQRHLHCLDTPGHARHHICLYDDLSRGIFTGDTFGLSYREFDTPQGPFILPTTTPVQFDPAAWHSSLERLLMLQPLSLYLTHFGRIGEAHKRAAELHRGLDDFVAIAERAGTPPELSELQQELLEWAVDKLAQHGCRLGNERIRQLLEMDLELNAQGLEIWLSRQARQGH